MKDLSIWKKSRENILIKNIKETLEDYSKLNLKYINYIKDFIINKTNANNNYNILEPGCGFGAGTYYLSNYINNLDFSLLDYDEKVIKDIKITYADLNKNFSFYSQDMFNTSFENETFDFIYNSGVLEHFNYSERINIFKEYSRILKKGGFMFIVIPNHYNIIYKSFYWLANFLGRWKVAKEYGIYDFKKECDENGLEFIERKTFIENSIYGYLTLLIIKKF